MMIRTAGGPGSVSPIDFNERRRPLPRATWIAIGVVAVAHVAVGVMLYNQRFELAPQPTVDEIPPTIVTMFKPPKPPVPTPTPRPAAPNTPTHQSPVTPLIQETLAAVHTDVTATDAHTITLTTVVPDPVVEAEPAAAPKPTSAPLITNPSWIRQPSADQMIRAYPARANNAGVSGRATLNCAVRVDGTVAGCSVTRETPGGYGFGQAAQGLSRYFRINPRLVNGAAVDGARVDINLRFDAPRD